MKATCKFCDRSLEVIMLERPQFPNHKEEIGSINACEGSGQPVSLASEDYDGPETVSVFGKISGRRGSSIGDKIMKAATKANAPLRMPSTVPSWHDREEQKEWKW